VTHVIVRMIRSRRAVALMAFCALGTGCTHTSLRQNTLQTAETLNDLQYQMVLSNLAMAK